MSGACLSSVLHRVDLKVGILRHQGSHLPKPDFTPSEKGTVEFKRFQQMEFRVEAGDRAPAPHGLPMPDLVVVTPDRGERRVLHTPKTVITLDRPVSPGSKVY